MEFTLLYCRKRVSKAMRAGEARHKKLVEEVNSKFQELYSLQSFHPVSNNMLLLALLV